MPGPPPKREAERMRRNDYGPTEKVGVEPEDRKDDDGPPPEANLTFQLDLNPDPGPPEEGWHDMAKQLWNAMLVDPVRMWMGPAGWAYTRITMEMISRELNEQFAGISETSGEPVYAVMPMKGTTMSALLKWAAAIGLNEADRLRIQKEVTFAKKMTEIPEGESNVTDIGEARSALLNQQRTN